MDSRADTCDPRDAAYVLRLRMRDWMWPSALAIALAIPLLGQTSGSYRIGSLADVMNTFGPPLFVALLAFAGLRWCWVGRLAVRDVAARPVRILLDLPGLIVAGFALWVVVMVALAMLGVIDLD